MGKKLPGKGRTYRQRLLSLPGVKLLESKRLWRHWHNRGRTCDLVEVRRRSGRF